MFTTGQGNGHSRLAVREPAPAPAALVRPEPGADFVLTYHAREVACWLTEDRSL